MRVSGLFILKTASLGLAVLMSTSSLFAQQSWQFETTRAPLSIANDGSITLRGDNFSGTVVPSGYFSISDAGADFVVSSNQDLMVGTNSTPAELPLRILTKRPTDLQRSELAGAWQYREYAILQPESGSAIYPIEIQNLGIDLETSGALKIDGIISGSAELGSAQNVILKVGNESFDFAINASKDLMASISQSQGDVLLRLIVRVDNGGNTADLAGSWTLARFGINLGFPDMGFALTNADLSVAADGTTRLGGESITLSSSGNGTVTVTDREGNSSLAWSHSRQLLLEAESQDNEFALPLLLRRASNPSASDLAGTWDLQELIITSTELSETVAEAFDANGLLTERYEFIPGSNGQRLRNGLSVSFYPGGQVRQQETCWLADAEAGTSIKDGTATHYDLDGTTERRREQWTLGALHGEPAVEEWDAQGSETLNENWNSGVITQKIERTYDDLEPNLLSSQTLSTYTEGEKATELREFYHGGSSALESRISLAFTNGAETRRTLVNFKIDGVTRSDDLERTFDPLTGITEESRRTYLEDGVGLLSSEFLRYSDPASPLSEISTSYHDDGSTVSQRTTTTPSESGVSILNERFYASGQESYRGTTDGDFRQQGTIITWHENGNVASRTNYSNGIQHGLTERYNTAAQPTLVATYAFGEITESTTTTYYTDGTQQFEQVTVNGDEQVITSRQWYANGQLQFQTRSVDDLQDGVQKTFDDLGNPTSEQNYSAGLLDGPSYEWHVGTAQLATERNYTEGLLNGIYRDWFADGQLQVLRNYLSGYLNGRGEVYNQSGQPLRIEAWSLDQLRSLEYWNYYEDGTLQSHSTGSIRFGDLEELDAEQSIVEYYDAQGRISSYSELAYGKYHGEVRSYHEGVLMKRSQYQDGMLEGLEQTYLYLDNTSDTRFGKRVSETLYSRGLRQGLSKEYNPATGLLVKEAHYQRDLLHGSYKEYKASILIYQGIYAYGARDGLHSSYRDDGTLQQTATYESDVLDGAWTQYHTNENTQLRGHYDRGLKTGTWEEYWADGGLKESTDYLADYRDGVYERWDEQSRRILRENYRGGNRDGLSETFTAGVLSSSTVYSDGFEVGPRKSYYPNGQLASNTPLDQFGRVDGLVTSYFSDGQVSSKSNYQAGLLHGSSETFHQDGPRASLTNYSANMLDGTYQRWHFNGQLSQSGRYSDGNPCGIWRSYDQAGNLISEENNGSCPGGGDPEFPIARGFEGVLRLNGQPVPGAYLSVASGEESLGSLNVFGDGSFRYGPLAQGNERTSFTLTVPAAPGWLEKVVNVTVPLQDGFVPVSIDLEPAENTAPGISLAGGVTQAAQSTQVYDFVSVPALIDIALTVSDTENDADALETSIHLSNPALFQSAQILGVGANRFVRLTTKPDTAGSSRLTVTVSDGELSTPVTAELRFAHAIVSRILRGSASVLRAGQLQPLALGDPIFEGELIKTDELGIIRLQTPEGSVFTIGSDSQMQLNRVQAGGPGTIQLIRAKVIEGYLRTEATTDSDRELEVETATASLGVRGTIFEVIVDEVDGLPRTQIFVEEGLVETTDLDSGSINQLGIGESAVIEGSPPFVYDWTPLGSKSGRFDFATDPGYIYRLQASVDPSFALDALVVLEEQSGDGQNRSLSYDDSNAGLTKRFFRISRQKE